MGNENIGRRRCDSGFSFCVASGVLGKTDQRRHDIDSYDRSSSHASAALPELFADIGFVNVILGNRYPGTTNPTDRQKQDCLYRKGEWMN